MKKFIIPLSVGAIALLASGNSAKAAYFSPLTGYTSADLEAQINNGSFLEEFNASSNAGYSEGPSYEMEIVDIDPPDTVVGNSTGQYSWVNGESVDFELSFDGNDLTYTVGDRTIQSFDVNQGDLDINGMILSANSTGSSSSTLSNLMLDDGSMSMEDLFSEGGETDFLKIAGIDNTFTLTGTQTFAWDGERPADFDLAYQIRVGTFQDPIVSLNNDHTEIPEPTTISILSLSAVAFGLKRRRKQQN